MVYWEYNLGITERNMEIKEYTEFKADEILQLDRVYGRYACIGARVQKFSAYFGSI